MVLKQGVKITLSFTFIALKHPTVMRDMQYRLVTKPWDTWLLSHSNQGIGNTGTKGYNYQAQLTLVNSS